MTGAPEWTRDCAWLTIAPATRGWLCPRFMTLIPVAKSMYLLPSTSVTVAPWPDRANTGTVEAIPFGMYRSRFCCSLWDSGPGQSALMLLHYPAAAMYIPDRSNHSGGDSWPP